MRFTYIIVALSLAGCASQPDVPVDPKAYSHRICLSLEPEAAGWRELERPPSNALELKGVAFRDQWGDPSSSDPTEIWYQSGSRMMLCSTSGAARCGHTKWKLKQVQGTWVSDGSDMVMCQTRR